MIKVKIVRQLEKMFNGLTVFIDVEESDGTECVACHEPGQSCITRRFNVAKILRGAVPLRLDSHFSREVQTFVRRKMGEGKSLCLDCFEKRVDDKLGGFEPAN